MTFLTPFMLWGAMAAGIPVAIHLFFRSRYRTVPWAAMKFLLTSVEQTSRRLKFQELILLLLRMAVLILLALAFARPISSMLKGTGRGEAVDAVFVFDTSFSMGASDGENKTRLDRAKAQASHILDELPPHSTIQILTCAGKRKALLGPRTPANLDQARDILTKDLELDHLSTNLALGVEEAYGVLQRGQASNKEFYLFSDMQKNGFDEQPAELKNALASIKEKAVVHFVRCGTQSKLKNGAVVNIVPQAGVPRPGERVDFAVFVKNTGTEPLEKTFLSLDVIEKKKKGDTDPARLPGKRNEKVEVPKIAPGATEAVTITVKLTEPGLTVLTARLTNDQMEGDNQFDQVIQVRDQVNILVVDGKYSEREPEKSSSFFLMHSLLPVKETERATYKYNPRVVPARLAAPTLLGNQHVCILVNCALEFKAGAEKLPDDFRQELEKFVRKGKGLIIFSGDNVVPDSYNRLLGDKHRLLPLKLKDVVKAEPTKPYFVNRSSFRDGPSVFRNFSEDKYYEIFDAVAVYRHLEMDEKTPFAKPEKKIASPKEDGGEAPQTAVVADVETENLAHVIMRAGTGEAVEQLGEKKSDIRVAERGGALAATKKVGEGEVIFMATAAGFEGFEEDTTRKSLMLPKWTTIHTLPTLLYFVEASLGHIAHGQSQAFNIGAGDTLSWFPTGNTDLVHDLVYPNSKVTRLGLPEKKAGRKVVTAADLPQAGVYRMIATATGATASETIDAATAETLGTPIAVTYEAKEIDRLSPLTDGEINSAIGFTPIHIVAGQAAAASTGEDRLNREWTVWVLLAVLLLALIEVAFAWFCSKAW